MHSEDSVLDAPVPASPSTVAAKELHGVVAEFDSPERLLNAIRTARDEGYTKLDACTPFPVHGIDEALGEGRSKLGYIVLGGGVTGMAAALLLQWWTGAVDYPLVIGGKPFFAFEFSIPVTFELTILLSAFAAVFGMLALNGLPRLYHPLFNYSRYRGASDDKFLLVLENDRGFRAEEAMRLMRSLGAGNVEAVED